MSQLVLGSSEEGSHYYRLCHMISDDSEGSHGEVRGVDLEKSA